MKRIFENLKEFIGNTESQKNEHISKLFPALANNSENRDEKFIFDYFWSIFNYLTGKKWTISKKL